MGNYGQPINFDLNATGMAPLTYQWQKLDANGSWNTLNSTALGNHNSSIELGSATETDIGSYRCLVSNGLGSVTSSVFTVQVMAKPFIVSQPVDVNATLGGNFTLTAGAESNGTATPLTYQWYRNGVAIKGATGSTYSASGLRNDSPAIGRVAGTENSSKVHWMICVFTTET